MNLQQLGTGGPDIGYFFLLAVLAGGLCFMLAMTLKPLEVAWQRARRNFALREYQDDNKSLVESTTKRQIFWSFVRRHFLSAKIIYDEWEQAKYALAEKKQRILGELVDPEELSLHAILWYLCRDGARRISQRLRNLKPTTSTIKDSTEP